METLWDDGYNENAMQTSTFQTRHFMPHPANHPDHGGLNVSVIAIPVRPVRTNSGMKQVLAALSLHSAVPVIDSRKRVLWTMGERDLVISPKLHPEDPASTLTLHVKSTISEAREAFERTGQMLIPLVDDRKRYTGLCASRTQLMRLDMNILRPARVGGLATPFGVYLTSGYYSAGAGAKGLIATGVLFGCLAYAMDWIQVIVYSGLAAIAPEITAWSGSTMMIFQMLFMLVGLLSLLRLSPLSGLHAAEHMTINAIESDMDLTEENVRIQPRVHLRCGTNLMVLMGGLQVAVMSTLAMTNQLSPEGLLLYGLFWTFLILKFWMPAGLWIQNHFTTRRPSPSELASGLKAGNELLAKFEARPHAQPSFLQKLWGAGLIHILFSFIATTTLISWLTGLLT